MLLAAIPGGSTVWAADLTPAPRVAAVAVADWTGPYLGMSFGDRWANAEWTTTRAGAALLPPVPGATPAIVASEDHAFRAASYFGYNLQAGSHFVIGIEADVAGALSARRIQGIPGVVSSLVRDGVGIREGWDASIRGRAGALLTPSILLYGTGGVSWQEFGLSATCLVVDVSWCTATRGEAISVVRQGWTAGAGIEARIAPHWLARAEYRYADYGRLDHTFFAAVPANRVEMHAKLHTQTALFGLAYQFGEQAAATAAAMPVKAKASDVAASSWKTTFASDFRYYSWESNRGFPSNVPTAQGNGRGTEIYVPIAMQIAGRTSDDVKVELTGRSGWVWARQSTAGLSGEVSTATDTQLSGTVTYLGLNGLQPFAAMSANLPTGQSNLSGSAAFARMDPDLVGLGSFGEGFNIGPSIGFNVPVTPQFIWTTSVGYTWRGNYQRENSLAAIYPTFQAQTRVEPGNVFTLTQTLAWQTGALQTQLTGSISEETTTSENGLPLYKPGRRFLLSGTWNYSWPEQWGVTTFTAAGTHTNRNEVLFGGLPPPVQEIFNSNSDVYRAGIQHLFPIGTFAIGPSASYLHRNHNSYDPASLQFVPQKERWAGGLIARYAATTTLTFNARLDRVWTRENENPAPGGSKLSVLTGVPIPAVSVPVVNGTGWQVTGGLNASF